jgi:glycine betaine catabolism B
MATIPQTFDAQIIEKREEVPGVVTLRLKPLDSRKIQFSAGQFAMVCFIDEPDPQRKCRAYSVSSSPSQQDWVELTIKIVKEWTTRMTSMSVGSKVQVKVPFGHFVLDESCEHHVFIAGGVGITPFASMAAYLSEQKSPKKATLFYSAKTPQMLIFRERFSKIAREWPNLTLAWTITDKEYNGADWTGHRGRLDGEYIKSQLGGIEGKTFYLCGSQDMMNGIEAVLLSINVPKERIRSEKFG